MEPNRCNENWFIERFYLIQEKTLLESTLGMDDLYEYKKHKGKHIFKRLYVKNRKVFIRRFKEKFGNGEAVLKNFIRIYLQLKKDVVFKDADAHKIIISNVPICGQYLKSYQDNNYRFLEEGEGTEGTQIRFP